MTSVFKFPTSKTKGLKVLSLSLYSLFPIIFVGMSADLASEVGQGFGRFIEVITNSAGSKGFLLSLAVLCLLTATLKIPSNRIIGLGLQLAMILALSFMVKTTLKTVTESPRPYVEYLSEQRVINAPEDFYQLNMIERNSAIDSTQGYVSEWRTKHWQGEKDYSFPSGHTIFVAICVAFFGGLFLERQQYWLVTGLLVWAGIVAYSRLWLGMHRPMDLVGSIALGAMIYLLVPTFQGGKVEQWLNRWLPATK